MNIRQEYETLRLAQWSIIDAITAAGHITSRACDCFEGTSHHEAFEDLRNAIGRMVASPEMRAIKDRLYDVRSKLDE